MAKATESLVRRLGVSGFCGFDFMIEDGTEAAHLIEMNARSTPLCHLALGAGRDPIAGLAARLEGAARRTPAAVTANPVIAYFPQAWLTMPDSELLRTGYHDVPWSDPALVRELVRAPYPDRGMLARLFAWPGWRNARRRVGGGVLKRFGPNPGKGGARRDNVELCCNRLGIDAIVGGLGRES